MWDLHIHTTFSDGKNTPEEVVVKAIDLGYQAVALCDHVRYETIWFEDYLREIARLRRKYGRFIRICTAVEAKVSDLAGTIDARPQHFEVDIFYVAVHRIPAQNGTFCSERVGAEDLKRLWFRCLFAALKKNPKVTAVAHPLFPASHYGIGLTAVDIAMLQREFVAARKVVELNLRHPHPLDDKLLSGLPGRVIAIGSDAHSVEDVEATAKTIRAISRRQREYGERLWLPPVRESG